MSKTASPTKPTTLPTAASSAGRQTFLIMALNMSWQLAIVVLVPVVGGALLDRKAHTSVYVFVGLALALIGATAVMWNAMQTANKLPVPKLTAAQKRKIQKQYEEDDKDD